MDITTRSGKVLPKPYPVVHPHVNDVVFNDEVMVNNDVMEK